MILTASELDDLIIGKIIMWTLYNDHGQLLAQPFEDGQCHCIIFDDNYIFFDRVIFFFNHALLNKMIFDVDRKFDVSETAYIAVFSLSA